MDEGGIKMSRNAYFEIVRTIVTILISLLFAFVIILLVSKEPWNAYSKMLFGPISSVRHFGNIIELSIPLIFTGLAVCIMFQAKQFNMMAEGSFFIGAIAASVIAINIKLPNGIHPAITIIIGGIAGGAAIFIPAILKSKWHANELVSSLMMNHISLLLGLFIVNFYLRDPNAGTLASFEFQATSVLPRIIPKTRIHLGIFIAIFMIVFTYYFLYKTRWGYALRMTGYNIEFSNYSGINTSFVVLYSQIMGGIIAGIGGATEILGMYSRFEWYKLPEYGWDGIIVAILAKNNPLLVPVGAFFLAYLRIGADIMSRTSDVASEIVAVIQALIIMLITAEAFLSKWKHNMLVKQTISEGANINAVHN